jgi:G3E family GTPase
MTANFALDIFKSNAAMAQIVHGDVIVLNKTDLVTESEIASLQRRISLIKPRTRILCAEYGRVPHAVMLGAFDESNLSPLFCADASDSPHLARDGFAANAFRFDGYLSAQMFQAWLDRKLPPGVFRAKGIVALDSTDRRFVFQLCGSRAAFEPYDGPIMDCRLVFIGREINETSLSESLHACIVPAPAPNPPSRRDRTLTSDSQKSQYRATGSQSLLAEQPTTDSKWEEGPPRAIVRPLEWVSQRQLASEPKRK